MKNEYDDDEVWVSYRQTQRNARNADAKIARLEAALAEAVELLRAVRHRYADSYIEVWYPGMCAFLDKHSEEDECAND